MADPAKAKPEKKKGAANKKGKAAEPKGQTTEVTTGQLVPQPHGGALRYGGTNRGGPGRPPSKIRQVAREAWADRLPMLMGIADGEIPIRLMAKCEHCGKPPSEPVTLEDVLKVAPDTSDRLRAMDQLAKYGLGTTKELTVEHIRERLEEQIRLIQEAFPPDVAEQVIRVIEPVWRRK